MLDTISKQQWVPCLLKLMIGGQIILVLQKILESKGTEEIKLSKEIIKHIRDSADEWSDTVIRN